MSGAELWGAGSIVAVILLASVYIGLLLRGIRNERVIGDAIRAMVAARSVPANAPQRALLRDVADILWRQERAAARIEETVYESAGPDHGVADPEELLREMLALPEPQLLVTGFLAEYGGVPGVPGAPGVPGVPGAAGAFDAFAAQLVTTAVAKVHADLGEDSIVLEKLTALAMDGRIAAVALAGLGLAGTLVPAHAPRLTEGDREAIAGIAVALEQATRRQLRLATLLHGQADAMLRLRERASQTGSRTMRARVHRLLVLPRLRVWQPGFQASDLEELEIAFDAIGEVVATAAAYLAGDEAAHAVYLLTGTQVPAPGGFPARIYNQAALAQVRPLAALGVWHRLAVCRWAVASLDVIARGLPWPPSSEGGEK